MRSVIISQLGLVALSSLALLAGCGDDEGGDKGPCSPAEQTGCTTGLACEEVEGGEPACFAPLHIKGRVYDLTKDSPIAAAQVVARDANGAAVSRVAATAADGGYQLQVPAKRSPEGKIL